MIAWLTVAVPVVAPSAPVTVTVCSWSQSALVKVSVAGLTVARAVDELVGVMTTLPPGWLFRRTL